MPLLHVLGVAFGFECSHPGSSPACNQIGGHGAVIVTIPELSGQLQQCAEQSCSVIIRQLHQVCFDDQAAEFDQVPCSFTACLGPIARVDAGACGIEAVTFHCQPPQPYYCRLQVPEQVQ